MARSKVEKLPEGARKSLEEWLREFLAGRLSLDQVMERAEALFAFNGLSADAAPSRSAVHRYSHKFAAVAERVKRAQAFREMLVAEAGPQIADGKGLQVMAQAFESLVYDMLGNMEDGKSLDPEQLMFFAKSIQAVSSALKTDADRALQIEKATLKKVAERVDAVAKREGWSADTARKARAEILGVRLDEPKPKEDGS
jgi:hypothetical protein